MLLTPMQIATKIRTLEEKVRNISQRLEAMGREMNHEMNRDSGEPVDLPRPIKPPSAPKRPPAPKAPQKDAGRDAPKKAK